jgi:hypothetical protein
MPRASGEIRKRERATVSAEGRTLPEAAERSGGVCKIRKARVRGPRRRLATLRVMPRLQVIQARALRSGELVKPDECEACRRITPRTVVESRSLVACCEDETQPLKVQWLCRRCHTLKHQRGYTGSDWFHIARVHSSDAAWVPDSLKPHKGETLQAWIERVYAYFNP